MKCNKVNNRLTCGGVTQGCRLYCTFGFTVISNVTFFGNSTEFGQVVRCFSRNNVSALIIIIIIIIIFLYVEQESRLWTRFQNSLIKI